MHGAALGFVLGLTGGFQKGKTMAIRGAYKKEFAQTWIKSERIKKNLTQKECAKLCGVGLRTYQRAEAGGSFDLQRSTKYKIERALGAKW